MSKKYKVYIIARYSDGDTLDQEARRSNVIYSMAVADRLIKDGFIVFNPLLSHFQDRDFPMPYETWLEQDAEWIKVCDMVLRLSGGGTGVERDSQVAVTHGIPVALSEAECRHLRIFIETKSAGEARFELLSNP